MAHAIEETKEPGGTSQAEGKKDSSSPLFPKLKFTLRDATNSLHILIHDTKSKRIFSNSFSKSTLESMRFHGSIEKVIHLINAAKSGKNDKYQFKFEILYDDAKNEKVAIEKMSKFYNKGNCMYMIVSVDELIMSATWPFKLLEQKRNEVDILKDIIEDLQNEVDVLKKKLEIHVNHVPGIAVWKASAAVWGIMKWDVEAIPPTIKDLAKRQNDDQDIVIGISGCYRVSIRYGWDNDSGSANIYKHELRVNGSTVATVPCLRLSAFEMREVLHLNKGDKLDFSNNGSCRAFDATYNNFTLELLFRK